LLAIAGDAEKLDWDVQRLKDWAELGRCRDANATLAGARNKLERKTDPKDDHYNPQMAGRQC
jgi:hypothetical protein